MTGRGGEHLDQILECAERLREYTGSGREAFFRETLIQDAVIRNFEVIGEATKRIGAGVRDLDRSVPWKTMAGFRDVLIHDYEGVDLDLVWNAVADLLDNVVPRLRAVRAQIGPGEGK